MQMRAYDDFYFFPFHVLKGPPPPPLPDDVLNIFFSGTPSYDILYAIVKYLAHSLYHSLLTTKF